MQQEYLSSMDPQKHRLRVKYAQMVNQHIDWGHKLAQARRISGMTLEAFAKQASVKPSLLQATARGQLLPDDELAEWLSDFIQSLTTTL